MLSELEFINEFKRAPGHQYWQTIELMQTTLKINNLSGLGRQFNFTFNAPCFKVLPKQGREKPTNDHPQGADDSDLDSMIWPTPEQVEHAYDGKIEFNHRQFGDTADEQRLMTSDPEMYCLKVCHKIGFYLQTIHNIDLLRMKVQFL